MRCGTIGLALAVATGVMSSSGEAAALLIDDASTEPTPVMPSADVELTYHYPFPTSLTYVDPRYAFEDDWLVVAPRRPYTMPVFVRRATVQRVLTSPRVSYRGAIVASAEML